MACPGEAELLALLDGAADVQDHVAACADCRGRLDRLRAELTGLRVASCPGPAPAALPRLFGRSLRRSPLCHDGPHEGYRALDPVLDRELVVRIGREPLPDDRTAERFLAGGRALAGVEHPHLVNVRGAGVQ